MYFWRAKSTERGVGLGRKTLRAPISVALMSSTTPEIHEIGASASTLVSDTPLSREQSDASVSEEQSAVSFETKK